MRYLYYAVFHRDPDSGYYEADFPDFSPFVASSGKDMKTAMKDAKDGLAGYLLQMEDDHEEIPKSSDPESIKVNQGDILSVIEVDTDFERAKEKSELVNKNVTIPKYLNVLGTSRKINFSQVLTKGLKKELGL